jgi:hypothetical protein
MRAAVIDEVGGTRRHRDAVEKHLVLTAEVPTNEVTGIRRHGHSDIDATHETTQDRSEIPVAR